MIECIKIFFENYGDVLSLIGSTYVCVISSFIQWIFQILQLIKAITLVTGSLILKYDHSDFFIFTTDSPENYENCYPFEYRRDGHTALKFIKGIFKFTVGLGITWAILQLLLILYMLLEATKKHRHKWLYQTKQQLYIEYFKFILTAYSIPLLYLLNQIEYNSDCIIDFPIKTIDAYFPVMINLIIITNCIIGNLFCWSNNENPHFCFSYTVSLLLCCCYTFEKQPGKFISCVFNFCGFAFMIFFSIVQSLNNWSIPLMISVIITMVFDIITFQIKYRRLKQNNFKPVEIKFNKYQSTDQVPTQN